LINVYRDIRKPIERELEGEGKLGVVSLSLPSPESRWGVSGTDLSAYMSKDIKGRVADRRRVFDGYWSVLEQDSGFKETFVCDGINFWRMIELKLCDLFTKGFPAFVEFTEVVKNLVKIEHPSAVLVMEDASPTLRTVVSAFNQTGTPTFVMQHGTINRVPTYPGRDVTAAKMLVWGEMIKKWFTDFGVKEDRLVSAGNPRYEALTEKYEGFCRGSFIRKLGLDPRRKTILFATQPFAGNTTASSPHEKTTLVKALFNAVNSLPDIQLIVKPHPTEDEGFYGRILDEAGGSRIIVVSKSRDTFDLIAACDAVVTENSTVGLEAMVLNKPLITMNLTGRPDTVQYAERGAALGVYSDKEIVPTVKRVFEDEETRMQLNEGRSRFISDYLGGNDGKSAERIVEAIYKSIMS